jgi:quercetin 2,3-dioxygenase
MATTRPETTHSAQPTQDGAGVRIRRINDFTGRLDPFLLLDELKASAREDYIGGFPPHPHRGFETLTYLVHGGLTHEDSMGNRGEVHAGEAQWMIVHYGPFVMNNFQEIKQAVADYEAGRLASPPGSMT